MRPSPPPFPMEIPALTSLRYCAAIWVVFYHFSHFTNAVALQEFPLVASGYLGVDFFFILSGFVLTHVYQPQIAAGHFDYWAFVSRRFARIYPMHAVTLAAFLLIGMMTRSGGLYVSEWVSGVSFAGVENAVLFRALIANLTLIHAWGSTPQLFFNQPSWSISAEWFAYLMFPVLILIRRLPPQAEGGKLIAVAGVFLLFAAGIAVALNIELTRLTWNAGILRIFPEFLIGMSLHRFGDTRSAGPRGAIAGLLLSAICVLMALLAGAALPRLTVLLATVAVLGLAGIVFFAADANRHGKLYTLGAQLPVYLGEISYSVYMVHLGVGIMLYDALLPRWRPTDVPTAVATVLAGLVAATIVSMLTYRFIEVPGRRWLVGRARTLQAPAVEARDDA
ncbi:acyltransferase [Microvirga sp. SRT01]|uniref:Acyltransferase n=1 Tax=Sphingomonas longa TaxID=2778730 RepID=A0ABS2D3D1_9SPHN|nr:MULTISPECIES: acyltransferase [Alphaproteobacteria]MBM6575436.1 acyltransferase [Sphingomonas sp. BT552]MBR7708484.1 acyltransferase [Microvirga sp. SRT01]